MWARAVAWSLGGHAAALVGLAGLAWLPATAPRSALATLAAPPVAGEAFAILDVRDERDPAPAPAVAQRAPGDAFVDLPRSGAPTAAANPDVAAGATSVARRESRDEVRATPQGAARAARPGAPRRQANPVATDAATPSEAVADRVDHLERVRQKVDPLWEFPRELAVRMEQGDLVVAFTIHKDGSVAEVRLLKGSGFDQFDRNVLAAIRKAAPFDPLPETFGAALRVTAPFEGANPAIR